MRDLWLRFVLRPLGRRLRTLRWEPHVVAPCTCLECGHEQVSVLPVDDPRHDRETGHCYGLECGVCGACACTTL